MLVDDAIFRTAVLKSGLFKKQKTVKFRTGMENTMKYEKLPEDMQKQIEELKHYVQTIQSDILDALESAKNLEEFHSQVDSNMDAIIIEAQKVREVLGTGKRSVIHG